MESQKKVIFERNGGEVPHPIIDIHIRHGDKSVEATLFPLEDYMKEAIKLKVRTKEEGTRTRVPGNEES